MKKEMNPASAAGRKLKLGKKTISNLATSENMNILHAEGKTRGITCFTHKCNPSW